MKKFEAKCLETVYEQAKEDFACSITDLEIYIIQQPSKGFLGFGRKNAIIEVSLKKSEKYPKKQTKSKNVKHKSIHIEDVSSKLKNSSKEQQVENKTKKTYSKNKKENKIFDNFYSHDKTENKVSKIIIQKDRDTILSEIKDDLKNLFSTLPYNISDLKVDYFDEQTVYIEFNGEDSALLIGKEGYRYKALSYILFNWINSKYNLMIRLEVAQFLKNQEEAVCSYIDSIIDLIEEKGMFKTKPLDGVLVHIALTLLREKFPNKYVAVKTNVRGDKYILINEYHRSKED